jgi:WD40 repeat protein
MGVVIGKQSAESMLLQVVDEHGGGIECMAVSDDLSVLATGSQDNTVRLWSIRGEECEGLHVLRGHYARITSVVFSEESVLSASVDKTIRRWDVLTGHCVFVCNGHLAQVNRILCTGDFIFSGTYARARARESV